MIKNVDLLETERYSYWNLLGLVLTITFLPFVIIFTSTLPNNNLANNLMFIIGIIISMIIILQFVLNRKDTTNTTLAYTIVLFLSISVILCCIKVGPALDVNLDYFKLIIFSFSLIFFWFNSEIFLSELKELLFYKFIEKNQIKLYTTKDNIKEKVFNNHWSPIDPFKIKFLGSDDKLIEENKNTYISIRRSRTHNTADAFSPIRNLIVCQKLLGNNNARQKYFNTIYITLIIINFIYFFSAAFITKTFVALHFHKEFLYFFMVSMIIINLSATIYLFIKHLKISDCDDKVISSNLQNNILVPSFTSIDKYYLTLNNETKFKHDKELQNLEETNNKLGEKLDSIYQIATPILFLSQITLAISLINHFYTKVP